MDPVERIAEAVLYEGYVLYPYRRSSLKNQKRWTFGGVYPSAYSEASSGEEPCRMQTQVLLSGDEDATLDVKVRFLQVTDRKVGRYRDGSTEFVEELTVGGQTYRPWEEAVEREVSLEGATLAELLEGRSLSVEVEAGEDREEIPSPEGEAAGVLVRSWRSLSGEVGLRAEEVEEVEDGLFRVEVVVENATRWSGLETTGREDALRNTFVSTHTILKAEGGEFVSLLEPPGKYAGAAGECENAGTWPVLVGEEGRRDTVLSSPIILYDYPQIAPESPGNLFDGSEIDELLTLSILSMTDEEKREMRESDPRTREILERTENLSEGEIMRLHGAMRDVRSLGSWSEDSWSDDSWSER